ncbi:MAG TPA: sensor histidine kinase [Polyangiales bacterium]
MIANGGGAWHGRWAAAVLGWLWLWLSAAPAAAEPEHALELTALSGSLSLESHCSALEDPDAALTLADVRAPKLASRFRPAPHGMSFGFKNSALWLRCRTENRAATSAHWVLELDYPLLDYVTLYTVPEDGPVEARATGDMLPFAWRDIVAANFAFHQESPPKSRTTYYVRVQTTGSLRAPLYAHRMGAYLERLLEQNVALWIFYGALMVMALFNIGVYVLIRQSEDLVFALLLLALGLVQFTLAGHTSQFLFPDSPLLANRVLPLDIALVLFLIPAYALTSFRQYEEFKGYVRMSRVAMLPGAGLLLLTLVAPPSLGLRVVIAFAVLLAIFGPFLLAPLMRHKNEQVGLYIWSWYCLVIAVPVHAARSANWIPPVPLTDFAVQIGIAVHGVITSLALATRLKVARDLLGQANARLFANVSDLKLALIQAEQATDAATQATLAKDQFMATMSHELRTPLNAIINVPQGLLDDFPEFAAAGCKACGARFLLDDGEVVTPELACPECATQSALESEIRIKYTGDPAHTARFLRKIERSGRHLLQMVNGVLDFSKMQANRLELDRVQVDVEALLHETLDEMSELAYQRQLSFTLEQSGPPAPLFADPVRLKQVLLNLISNAIKFSKPEGTITVRWTCDELRDVISVKDRGIGIAREHHARIFGSFEQVHKGETRKYGGTGLGLSISRSLVRMHGGEIWVESEAGEGSTFSFSIPRRIPEV